MADDFVIDATKAHSPGDLSSIKYTYTNSEGNYHLDGANGRAIYKWSDGKFYTDNLELTRFAFLNPGSDDVIIYRVPNQSFYFAFGTTGYRSPHPTVGEYYTLYYSYDGKNFKRLLTPNGTDRGPLTGTVPPPTGTGSTGAGGTGTGGSSSGGTGSSQTSPDGKKPQFPIKVEGYFGITKGYAWAEVGSDGYISLKINGKHSGTTGSTRFTGIVVVSGYRDGKENTVLNKPEPRTNTVGANSGSGVSEKDLTFTDFKPIANEDINNIRHVRVLMAKDKSGDNFVDTVTGMLQAAGTIAKEADSLYKQIKDSEIGQAAILIASS